MTSSTATLVGLTAIVMWSLLAALTVATGRVPPFQLLAMTFAIGACVGPLTWLWRPSAVRALRQPVLVWLVGIGGLFGYHALYFLALRLAPPAEAVGVQHPAGDRLAVAMPPAAFRAHPCRHHAQQQRGCHGEGEDGRARA